MKRSLELLFSPSTMATTTITAGTQTTTNKCTVTTYPGFHTKETLERPTTPTSIISPMTAAAMTATRMTPPSSPPPSQIRTTSQLVTNPPNAPGRTRRQRPRRLESRDDDSYHFFSLDAVSSPLLLPESPSSEPRYHDYSDMYSQGNDIHPENDMDNNNNNNQWDEELISYNSPSPSKRGRLCYRPSRISTEDMLQVRRLFD